jgi:hypothetical protein
MRGHSLLRRNGARRNETGSRDPGVPLGGEPNKTGTEAGGRFEEEHPLALFGFTKRERQPNRT